MNRHTLYHLAAFSIMVVMLSGCTLSPKKPGRTFMPDMQYSNAYETYAGSQSVTLNIKEDTMTARLPVKGTIPRGIIPMNEKVRSNEKYLMSYTLSNHVDDSPERYQEYYDMAGASLQNPIPLSKDDFAEAKQLYVIYCQVCHGTGGAGDGNIVVLPDGSDGPYTAIPPSYESRLPTISDGNMFYSISYGKGMMGGYGTQLNVEQRWKLVHYIKDMTKMYSESDYEAAKNAANTEDQNEIHEEDHGEGNDHSQS